MAESERVEPEPGPVDSVVEPAKMERDNDVHFGGQEITSWRTSEYAPGYRFDTVHVFVGLIMGSQFDSLQTKVGQLQPSGKYLQFICRKGCTHIPIDLAGYVPPSVLWTLPRPTRKPLEYGSGHPPRDMLN